MSELTRLNEFPWKNRIQCDIYACRNYAKYSIHREDISVGDRMNLCSECIHSILDNLPDEFKMTPVDGENLSQAQADAQEEIRTNERITPEQIDTVEEVQQLQDAANAQEGPQTQEEIEDFKRMSHEMGIYPEAEEPQPASKSEVPDTNDSERITIQPVGEPEIVKPDGHGILPTEDPPSKQGHGMEENQIQERMKEELESKNVKQLQELAKKREIPKYYEMKKDELVQALVEQGRNNE